jgi:hypothetical protein
MEKAELSEKAYAQENIGESDLVRYKDEVKRLELAEVDADMKFYAELEGFLRPGQVVRFIFFEHQFRREMSMELKKRYNKPEERKGFWQRRQK